MDRNALERVIEKAKVGSRTAKKLLKAFDDQNASACGDTAPSTSRSRKGHGAPADSTKPLTTF